MQSDSLIRSESVGINKTGVSIHPWSLLKWKHNECDVCGSLERELLFEDCLHTPKCDSPEEVNKQKQIFNLRDFKILKGEDITDVPTSYIVSDIQSHELPVIGTYVDRRIVPGFRYRVRLINTENYLFGGEALWLKTVGMGYGKRLTFHDGNLNKNRSYFWSDSYADGYCFSIQVVRPGDKYQIVSRNKNVTVTKTDSEQEEISEEVTDNGVYVKKIRVRFWCSENNTSDVCYCGVATVIKSPESLMASVKAIICQEYPFTNCTLVPSYKPKTSSWEKFEC
ncbi:uncharacterized protein [Centruroides vittatus]|uniref:uncharacterized protein n=1 Tax=Centruroides vittatus TaxID=120091 RepID=UPI00350FA656